MDISDFLASMQPDPASRALARNTKMGIPDADNDPSTQDAAPAMGGEQSAEGYGEGAVDNSAPAGPDMSQPQVPEDQNFAEGGGVQRWVDDPDGPLSENIEDRRGEPGSKDQMPVADASDFNNKNNLSGVTTWKKAWSHTADKIGGKFLAAGGDPDEEAMDEPAPPAAEQGAIPEPAGPEEPVARGFRQRLGDAMGMRGPQVQQGVTQEGQQGWKDQAMEAINAGLDYGRNEVHGVNRPVSDEDHEQHVTRYLSGEGAIDPHQFQSAERAVDPEGTMHPAERAQKVIGELFNHYSQQPDDAKPPAAVAWGAIQYLRKKFDALRAHATVADDRGNGEAAAQAAEAALNTVPDGTSVQVKYQGPEADPAAMSPVEQSPGAPSPVNAPRGGYAVSVFDPETSNPLISRALSPDQMKDLLVHFDEIIERGTPTAVAAAASKTEGHRRVGMAQGPMLDDAPNRQDAMPAPRGAAPPMPGGEAPAAPGAEGGAPQAGGASQSDNPAYASAISQVRLREWRRAAPDQPDPDPESWRGRLIAAGKDPLGDTGIKVVNPFGERGATPALEAAREASRGRIEAAKVGAAGREAVAGANNTSKQTIASNRETGLNGRQINAPGQMLANKRAIQSRAADDTKQWLANQPKRPAQPDIDAFTQERLRFWQQQGGGQQPEPQAGGQQQPSAAPQAPAAQAGAPKPPPMISRNGFNYQYDEKRGGYVRVGQQ